MADEKKKRDPKELFSKGSVGGTIIDRQKEQEEKMKKLFPGGVNPKKPIPPKN